MFRFVFLILFCFFLPLNSGSLYHWPVQGSKVITGSFGEFRRYNFHLGTDFATEGKEGLPILALTNGKVIKIQSYRYSIGNAIWLEHKDGFVSRYGHLQKFSEKILNSILSDEVKEKIFFRQDFEYNFSKENQPYFSIGEVLGYSGKTGLGPPHLHVDLFLGETHFNLADFLDTSSLETKIMVDYVELVPLDNTSFINSKNQSLKIKFESSYSDFYTYVERVPLLLQGKIGLKLAASEVTKSGNRLGLKAIALKINDILVQEIDFTKIYKPHAFQSCFIFDNYKSNMNGKPFLYYLYSREDSELLNLKFSKKENGVLNMETFMENVDYLVQIELIGITRKKLHLSFRIRRDTNQYPKSQNLEIAPNVFPNKEARIISSDEKVELLFSKDSVFIENYFSIFTNSTLDFYHPELQYLSEIYTILPDFREFNRGYILRISFDEARISDPQKVGLFLLSPSGIPYKLISKTWKNSSFTVNLNYTGHFRVLEDFSPPNVWLDKLKSGKKYKKDISIFIRAEDLGSGLDEKSILGFLDGEKAFFDYDPDLKKWELFYPQTYNSLGKHILEYWGKDILGNESEKQVFEYLIEE
ncbi:MAG: M23 family metallopeptidase [Leptospiraceae bacterium]|nr:M23 family metallopeptidase [Leptospiraceae bacterium]